MAKAIPTVKKTISTLVESRSEIPKWVLVSLTVCTNIETVILFTLSNHETPKISVKTAKKLPKKLCLHKLRVFPSLFGCKAFQTLFLKWCLELCFLPQMSVYAVFNPPVPR